MKKIVTVLALIALALCGPARAQLEVTQLHGFNVGGDAAPVITFLQCSTSNPTGSNPYTFASQNVGAEAAGRYTIVGVAAEDGSSSFGVNSMTIGGDSATEIVDEGGTRSASAALYIMSNPSGTSESIVVTMSEAITNSSVCLWSVTGLSSATATDTATGNSNTNPAAIALDVDLSAGGVGAAVCGETGTSVTFLWSGFNEQADGTATGMNRTAADYTATAAEPGKSVSVTRNGSGASGCAAATFR